MSKNGRTIEAFRLNQRPINPLKSSADSAMILGKLHKDLRRENITPGLNLAYKHVSFPHGEHPKLSFGDDTARAIKELTETNKTGQCLSRNITFKVNLVKVIVYLQIQTLQDEAVVTSLFSMRAEVQEEKSKRIIKTAKPTNHTSLKAIEADNTTPLSCERYL